MTNISRDHNPVDRQMQIFVLGCGMTSALMLAGLAYVWADRNGQHSAVEAAGGVGACEQVVRTLTTDKEEPLGILEYARIRTVYNECSGGIFTVTINHESGSAFVDDRRYEYRFDTVNGTFFMASFVEGRLLDNPSTGLGFLQNSPDEQRLLDNARAVLTASSPQTKP